jgi:hypothetical protein
MFAALLITFAVSAVGHGLLTMFALGEFPIAAACATFFIVQPLFITAERQLDVRRWKAPAGWAWTIGILAITSPFIVEPVLRIAEMSWPASSNAVRPTFAVLGLVVVVTGTASLASLLAATRSGISAAQLAE